MLRWPVVALVSATLLFLTSAVLKLHVVAMPVVAAVFPLGDVPGSGVCTGCAETLYLNTSAMYITFAAFGNVALSTNTTGWRVLAVTDTWWPPIAASTTLPPKEGCLRVVWRGAWEHELKLCNYNGTHGVVIYEVLEVLTAQIVEVGRLYVWYPVAPDEALVKFAAEKVGMKVVITLFVPDRARFRYLSSRSTIIYCADGYNAREDEWRRYPDWCYGLGIEVHRFHNLTRAEALDATTLLVIDNGTLVYVLWPILVYYQPGPTSTYLHVQVG